MTFNYNSTGIKDNEHTTKEIAPEGDYTLVIEDAVEQFSKKNNYPMIRLDLKIVENVDYQGITFRHWVVFIPPTEKGAGINVHFRKCIGVPYEGDVEVHAENWIGKKFSARVIVDNVPNDKGIMRFNKIKYMDKYGDTFPAVETDTVPF
jgi:hypothetical protein